jgi:hypothetical protein
VRCILCDCAIDDQNDSEEHVIPSSIGGRLRVRGFLCKDCNNRTGSTWDGKLAEQLNFWCLFFSIVRERGQPPPERVQTTAGERLSMQPSGGFSPSRPIYQEVKSETGTQIQITARTMREASKMLRGVARKFPSVNPEAELKKAALERHYPYGGAGAILGAVLGAVGVHVRS